MGGQPAGICALKFNGDGDILGSNNFDKSYADCRTLCGLGCMSMLECGNSVGTRDCYVDHICVDSKFRGKGIGKVLMIASENEARKRGCNNMYLYVTTDNRARSLYEREGYSIKNTADGYCLTYCTVGVRRFYRMDKPLP